MSKPRSSSPALLSAHFCSIPLFRFLLLIALAYLPHSPFDPSRFSSSPSSSRSTSRASPPLQLKSNLEERLTLTKRRKELPPRAQRKDDAQRSADGGGERAGRARTTVNETKRGRPRRTRSHRPPRRARARAGRRERRSRRSQRKGTRPPARDATQGADPTRRALENP